MFLLFFLVLGSVYSQSNETVELSESNQTQDFKCSVGEAYLDDDENVVSIDFSQNYEKKGNITVLIDDEIYYNQPLKDKLQSLYDLPYEVWAGMDEKYPYYIDISRNQFDKPLTFGSHNILVKNI